VMSFRRPSGPRVSGLVLRIATTAAIALTAAGAARTVSASAAVERRSAASTASISEPPITGPDGPAAPAPTLVPTPPATTERDSVAAGGAQLDGNSGGTNEFLAGTRPNQAISADGRWVAFISTAPALGAGATRPLLYVHDRQTGAVAPVPWLGGGPFPAGVSAAEPAISADGGAVAFTIVVAPSVQTGGLSSGSTTVTPYVVVWDRASNATSLVSIDSSSKPLPAYQPSISADGRYVAYTTWLAPDSTPPALSNLSVSPNCFGSGGTVTISVTASDPDDAVASLQIDVSPPGGSPFTGSMSAGSGNTWTYQLTGQPGWTNGVVDYTATATDSHGNAATVASSQDTSSPSYLSFQPNGCIF